MRHITISEFGTFLGVSGNRLVVSSNDDTKRWETVLSRVRTIRIEKTGVSVSSNLIAACAARGIRLYFTDWRNIAIAAVSGCHQHAVVFLRQAQFECLKTLDALYLAQEIIYTKVRNQRAVLLYFCKYINKENQNIGLNLKASAEKLASIAKLIKSDCLLKQGDNWREVLLGFEGQAAQMYWQALQAAHLLPDTFQERQGRGATEITNGALNYGYTILQSYAWSTLDNAGFELYAGFLHTHRPGRASLVLDFMEEYRAWVVDRNVIKLRFLLKNSEVLDAKIKKELSNAIDTTMSSTISWHNKNIRLENVMQRQAYRLAGSVVDKRRYRGLKFKW